MRGGGGRGLERLHWTSHSELEYFAVKKFPLKKEPVRLVLQYIKTRGGQCTGDERYSVITI